MTTRLIPAAGIFAVGLLAWAWFVQVGNSMSAHAAMPGMAMEPGMLGLMWATMMLAMMVPAATPSFMLYSRMSGRWLASAAYLGGYLGVWAGAGLVYALAHWWLQSLNLMGGDMRLSSSPAAGAVLVGAGLWQWSSVKAGCVARCRSPLSFLLTGWHDGASGGLLMGVRYALWCLGCCWLVMAVLFVAGAMSFAWAAAISAYVLLERLLPLGRLFDRVTGTVLAVWGVWLIVTPLL